MTTYFSEAQFQKLVEDHREHIETLLQCGAFDMKNGTVYLHFDKDGTLMSVKTEAKIYQRKVVDK